MKLLFCCLVLGALPALGQRDVLHAPITLYTDFKQDPPPAVLEALQNEVDSLLAPMEMPIEWRLLSSAHGNEISADLAVLTFKGTCDPDHSVPVQRNPGALGWTHISDGIVLPFSEVDCDRVGGFLELRMMDTPEERRDAVFGRALGRVAAHELYHVFARTMKHGSDGVGKPAYTVDELVSPDLEFESSEMDALRWRRGHTHFSSGN
jgi:hypothetical protein